MALSPDGDDIPGIGSRLHVLDVDSVRSDIRPGGQHRSSVLVHVLPVHLATDTPPPSDDPMNAISSEPGTRGEPAPSVSPVVQSQGMVAVPVD